jgi:hypothetical protein
LLYINFLDLRIQNHDHERETVYHIKTSEEKFESITNRKF